MVEHGQNMIAVHNTEQENRRLLNKREIACRYGVSERTIQEWMGNGTIPFYKLGYLVRFDPAECDSALGRFKVPAQNMVSERGQIK